MDLIYQCQNYDFCDAFETLWGGVVVVQIFYGFKTCARLLILKHIKLFSQ